MATAYDDLMKMIERINRRFAKMPPDMRAATIRYFAPDDQTDQPKDAPND